MDMDKIKNIRDIIAGAESAVLAYSGGIDSGLLAVLCHEVLNDRFCAVTVKSIVLSEKELQDAVSFAEEKGFRHEIIETDLAEYKEFTENSRNRCYWCKSRIISIIKDFARRENIRNIFEASNMDDLKDFRPGMKAVREQGIIQPFILASVFKSEIRAYAANIGLSVHKKPQMACLATRIPYNEIITREKLFMIEQAESHLNIYGLKNIRVRHHERIARIEVDRDDMPIILANSQDIARIFKQLGFMYVTLDIEGFRSGSMNEAL